MVWFRKADSETYDFKQFLFQTSADLVDRAKQEDHKQLQLLIVTPSVGLLGYLVVW